MCQLDFELSSIKIQMPYLLNINNLYFDMDISLYNYNILDIFVYVILLLLLLLLTIIYYSSIYGREKKLVNFNEDSVGIYDSGDDIHCSSSSDEGDYSSGNSDDGEDDDKLSRRRRRWLNNREYASKYSPVGRAYDPTKNNNKNYNTYARAVKDVFYGGRRPGNLRNHLLDKKMYKDTVRELNKANIQNPNLNLDLDTLSRVHANRYNKLLYNNYDYSNLSVDQLDFIAHRYNIKSLHDCKELFQSIDSDKLRVYLNVSESIHKKYINRTFKHTSKWDGWFARQVAKTLWK